MKKKKLLICSPEAKILHRDLVDSEFYKYMSINFDVDWIFFSKPSKNCLTQIKKFHIFKRPSNYRNKIWTILYYLEEEIIHDFWNWPNINTKLYLSKSLKNLVYFFIKFKLNKIVIFLCKILLNLSFPKKNIFKKHEIFVSINGGKGLEYDDLMRNAEINDCKKIFVPAGWDNISSKPLIVKPDHILVWGEQTKRLCKKLHKINPLILGTARYDIYKNNLSKKNSLKKLRLSEQKKYILVAGSGVTFNEKRLINRIVKYLKKNKLYKYQIIYRPHPNAQKRHYDEVLDFKNNSWIKLDPTLKRNYNLNDYPFLMSAIEGIITPYSSTVIEGLVNNLPCLTVGYHEKGKIIFDWKSFVQNSPHLRILKNRKFIVHCLDYNQLNIKLDNFFKIMRSNNKYNLDRQKLVNKIIFINKKNYNQKIHEVFSKVINYE